MKEIIEIYIKKKFQFLEKFKKSKKNKNYKSVSDKS